jgi:OFA family oxalate/formate antiporter-like MFS transporter
MLHRPSFWLFFVFNIAICAVGNTVISFARDLAINVGAAAELATTLVGVLSVCNGLGRIICGALFDSMGRKKTMLLECFLAIVAPGVTLLAVLSHSLLLGIVGLCLCGLCYGFSPTITSAFISNFYGLKNFAMNFGIANIQLVPASFIATLSAVLLSISGSYAAPFTLLVGLGVLGLVLNLCIRRP